MKRAARTVEQVKYRDVEGRKLCLRCEGWLPEDQFWAKAKAPDGLAGECVPCSARRTRDWGRSNPDKVTDGQLRKTFGIGLDEFNAMLARQGGACAICGSDDPGHRNARRLYVDHCHDSGAIRGLLCNNCNRGLGFLRDSPDLVRIAADYLDAKGWQE
jgi:hypothetical protein